MIEQKDDARRKAVLNHSFQAFTTYGYKRTTMDDIASAAGMSRPALYLLYRNKSDIFRACMIELMDGMRIEVAACFAGGAPDLEIKNALQVAIVRPYARIMETPHGAELFDLKNEYAADLFLAWIETIEKAIAAGLTQAHSQGRIDLARSGFSADRLATLLLNGVEGAKMRMASIEHLSATLDDLVDVMIGPLMHR